MAQQQGLQEFLIGDERRQVQVSSLIKKYGIEAYGIYMYLLRSLLAAKTHVLKNDYATLAEEMRCNSYLVQDVIEKSGMFVAGNNAFYADIIFEYVKDDSPKITKSNKVFERPSLDDVKQYYNSQGMKYCDAETFFNYYEANGWHVGRVKMSNWHAKLRAWERRALEQTQQVSEHERDRATSTNIAGKHSDF